MNFLEMASADSKLLHRWAKDYKAPIAYFEPGYMMYVLGRLAEYKPKAVRGLSLLIEEAKKYESAGCLMEAHRHIRDLLIEDIKGREAYEQFLKMDMNKYGVKNQFSSGKVYHAGNKGKVLVSVDLVSANYQIFKMLGIIRECDTWKEYVGKFTDSEYLKESKYIRQVVMGNCNPKRQTTVEQYYTKQVLDMLLEDVVQEKDIVAFYHDEVVYATDKVDTNFYNNLTKRVKEKTGLDVDLEVFEVEHVVDDFAIKHFINKPGYEIMGVPQKKFFQALDYAENREVDKRDLIFWDDGLPAKFLKNAYSDIERDSKWK